MAKKLRTGFELPFSNGNGASSKNYLFNSNYLFNNLSLGAYTISVTSKNISTAPNLNINAICQISYDSNARTKINNLGCYFRGGNNQYAYQVIAFDLSQFSNGFYSNYWLNNSNTSTRFFRFICLNDGTDFLTAYMDNSGTNTVLRVEKNGIDQTSLDLGYKLLSSTWYNTHVSVDNSGVISISINGSTSFTYATGTAFSSFTQLGACHAMVSGSRIDDLAINDGSGLTDNGLPNSIRAYNFFDQSTLDSQSGFSTVGGTTILANLTDGDDGTRVNCSTDLSEMNFSLPNLSATGMTENASNFSKIEAINIYARQIEATKANSVLKAKITDAVTNANREENISLPLTVANDSTTMFDDNSNDWSLTNLDSGNLDLKITFDKP